MIELAIGLITGAAGLIGTIWGIIKYYDQKKEKKEQQKEKQQLQQQEEHIKVVAALSKGVTQLTNLVHAQQKENKNIQNHIDNMQDQMQEMMLAIEENEMDRLRTDIVDCVSKIRNGYDVSPIDLEHIHHAYDKYKSKGGNSYIESCMSLIKEYEDEYNRVSLEFE